MRQVVARPPTKAENINTGNRKREMREVASEGIKQHDVESDREASVIH